MEPTQSFGSRLKTLLRRKSSMKLAKPPAEKESPSKVISDEEPEKEGGSKFKITMRYANSSFVEHLFPVFINLVN